VADIPTSSNFFASVTSATSLKIIADLYRSAGWDVRKCGWTEFEARSGIGELVIEGNPILVHGSVADPVANADAVTKPLRDGAIGFFFECYGPDRSLLLQSKWDPTGQQ
jgi:hypothetical protein